MHAASCLCSGFPGDRIGIAGTRKTRRLSQIRICCPMITSKSVAKRMKSSRKRRMEFYEFFAGGGMARLGLGDAWNCTFANDNEKRKAGSYKDNFDGASELKVCDIEDVEVSDLPGRADLAWASFPCQDLSLAGNGAGLRGERSALFWEFWRLIRGLSAEGRGPRTIILERPMRRSHRMVART